MQAIGVVMLVIVLTVFAVGLLKSQQDTLVRDLRCEQRRPRKRDDEDDDEDDKDDDWVSRGIIEDHQRNQLATIIVIAFIALIGLLGAVGFLRK